MFIKNSTLCATITGHCGDECLDYNENYLGWAAGGIGRQLVFMAVQGVGYWCILALLESGLLRRVWYAATYTQPSNATRQYSRQSSTSLLEVHEF